MAIPEALTTLGIAAKTIKALLDLLPKKENPEILSKITSLNGEIIKAQQEVFSLIDENRQLKSKIDELEKEVNTIHEMEFKHGIYWREGEGINDRGPFCPTCYDKDRKTIHLKEWGKGYLCNVCNYNTNPPVKTVAVMAAKTNYRTKR
jgi:hypothetical protein